MMKQQLVAIVALAILSACKFNSSTDKVQPAPAPTIAVDPKTVPPSGKDTDATVSTKGNALVATSLAEAPPCTPEGKGGLIYEVTAKKFYICDTTWTEVLIESAVATPSATAAPTAAPVKLITREVPESSGANCRYGGRKVESGIDADNNGTLSDTEATSKVYVCDGNIETVAKDEFLLYFQSVGVVVSTYKHLLGCETATAGTGWLLNDFAVTNQHVVEQKFNFTCYGVPADGTLSKVTLHLPKMTFKGDEILRSGLPHYVGFTPSAEDFDPFMVDLIDRGPTTAASDRADLAFLHIGATGRKAFTLSDSISTSDSPKTLRTGDEIVAIGYSVVQGPRLTMGRVFHIENCEALVRALAGSAYKPTSCLDELNVTEKTQMISYFGYGDHGGSGSPVLDRFGQVVGVHTWGAPEGLAPFNAAQTSADVKRFADKPRVWKKLSE